MARRLILVIVGLIVAITVAACNSSSGGSKTDSAVNVINAYLVTRNTGDTAQLIALSCKEFEDKARAEADFFRSRKATLENVVCTENGTDGNATLVKCEGKVVANYNGETKPTDLSRRQFRAVQEDGGWKMCGYK